MIAESNCGKRGCKHYRGVRWLDEDDESTEVHYCTAFPRGIPHRISYGKNLHLKPVRGDKGILFEKQTS